MDRKNWISRAHEKSVEDFYATGISDYHEYHNGYLNFGYWTREGMSYEEAAEGLVKRMGELLGLNAESELLDVGCGMGTQDVFLHKTFNPQKIDALDVTLKHIEIARARAKKNNIPEDRVAFYHGTAVDLPFPDNLFTHLLSIEAPEHFDTREAFFKEAYRVLVPDGRIALCDYSLARPMKNIFERAMVGFAQYAWRVPKANVYGNEVFAKKLEDIGFADIHIENVGALTIPGYYFEHRRSESVRNIKKLRGFWKGVVGGFLIDIGVYGGFRLGLVEYVIITARKP